MICFLVYNFNSPNKVRSNNNTNYFLNLKNEQYIDRTGKSLFEKLYSIIKDEQKNQEICIQIIEELLKERDFFIQDIVKETSIDYVLKMKDIHYSTEILKLLIFYWDIEENQDDFVRYKYTLTSSPFCEIMLDLKIGTEDSFEVLFDRYLNRMKIEYKGYPNLLQITLQKDRKYLLDYEIFLTNYRTFEKSYIDHEIPDDSKLLKLNDDYIFTILSDKQHKLQKQIMNSSEPKQFDKILIKLDYEEVEFLLLARSEEQYENVLEQMLRKKHKNYVHILLKQICSSYGLETFYTKKMLLMVNIMSSNYTLQ